MAIQAAHLSGYVQHYETRDNLPSLCRKWAILSDYCLYLYHSHQDREYDSSLILPGCNIAAVCTDDREQRLFIQISDIQNETTYVTPENGDEFEMWYNAICQSAMAANDEERQSNRSPMRDQKNNLKQYPADSSNMLSEYQHYPTTATFNGTNSQGDASPYIEESGYAKPWSNEFSSQGYAYNPITNRSFSSPTKQSGTNIDAYLPNTKRGDFQRRALSTVPEDSNHLDNQQLASVPLEDFRRKYPVSGLAKRMSISASDLLGKSHDELVLYLIQLNREEANLKQWRRYYQYHAESMRADITNLGGNVGQSLLDSLFQLEEELVDIENELELHQPLKTFIDNMVKMGSLYAGNNLMFASEYKRELVSPRDYTPAKMNIGFMRDVLEKEIAKELKTKLNVQQSTTSRDNMSLSMDPPPIGPLSPTSAGKYLSGVKKPTPWRPDSLAMSPTQTQDFIKTRQQLETELAGLEEIYQQMLETERHKRSRQPPTNTLQQNANNTPISLKSMNYPDWRPWDSTSNGRNSVLQGRNNSRGVSASPSLDGVATPTRNNLSALKQQQKAASAEKSAFLPRRSTRQLKRSDITNSQRRQEAIATAQRPRSPPSLPRRPLTRHLSVPRNLHLQDEDDNNFVSIQGHSTIPRDVNIQNEASAASVVYAQVIPRELRQSRRSPSQLVDNQTNYRHSAQVTREYEPAGRLPTFHGGRDVNGSNFDWDALHPSAKDYVMDLNVPLHAHRNDGLHTAQLAVVDDSTTRSQKSYQSELQERQMQSLERVSSWKIENSQNFIAEAHSTELSYAQPQSYKRQAPPIPIEKESFSVKPPLHARTGGNGSDDVERRPKIASTANKEPSRPYSAILDSSSSTRHSSSRDSVKEMKLNYQQPQLSSHSKGPTSALESQLKQLLLMDLEEPPPPTTLRSTTPTSKMWDMKTTSTSQSSYGRQTPSSYSHQQTSEPFSSKHSIRREPPPLDDAQLSSNTQNFLPQQSARYTPVNRGGGRVDVDFHMDGRVTPGQFYASNHNLSGDGQGENYSINVSTFGLPQNKPTEGTVDRNTVVLEDNARISQPYRGYEVSSNQPHDRSSRIPAKGFSNQQAPLRNYD